MEDDSMSVKIIKDDNKVPELIEALEKLSKSSVDIGIIGEGRKYEDEDVTVLDVGTINEFGATTRTGITIPERPFIRGTADNRKKEISDITEPLIDQVVHLEITPSIALEAIGTGVTDITKEYLTDLSSPPNSPYTIAAKGSSNPLIDDGYLRQGITYRVNE